MSPLDFNGSNDSVDKVSVVIPDVVKHCKDYHGADTRRSVIQMSVTLLLFGAICTAMFFALNISVFLTLALSPIAAGLLTRIFIFQHDCGHGSFFKSKKANDWAGRFFSLLTFTPYEFWKRAHNKHHASSGNLDNRSIGGIDTITNQEYDNMCDKNKARYRLYRNPLFLLLFGTPFYVIFVQRFPFNSSMGFYDQYVTVAQKLIWRSVLLSNICLLAFWGSVCMLLGASSVLIVYTPILVMTAWLGGWLFYVQHQFEDTYWEKHDKWDWAEAALMGSSYYEMPKILQWFTGNIGIHHIHHLSSKIPNYKLQECLDARPELKSINRLTLKESLKSLSLKLWDEDEAMMVSYKRI